MDGKSQDGKPSFVPVFRSGSCAERGPKQYMEDEHVCIDDLAEHFGAIEGHPSSGAFYGVSICLLFWYILSFLSFANKTGILLICSLKGCNLACYFLFLDSAVHFTLCSYDFA